MTTPPAQTGIQMTNQSPLDMLLDTMQTLRSTAGCQWDREQTAQSLKPYILEEACELLEAIDLNHPQMICDELGDLLLQIVFQAQIHAESGDFTFMDVASSINHKLIRRHPHIFSTASHAGHQQRWEEIKLQERTKAGKSNSIDARIPKTLPALKRADKTLKIISETGPCADIRKVTAQLTTLQDRHKTNPQDTTNLKVIFGQILLSVTELAQSVGVDAEDSLRCATNQMIEEFDNRTDHKKEHES